MPASYLPLSDSDRGKLREIFSIGVSKAADALSHLMRNQQAITLTVPDIRIVPPEEFPTEQARFAETVLAIKSHIKGTFNGIGILLFFQDQIEWIVQHCLTERERQRMEAGTLNIPLLLEVSNILTASILTQFTNLLELPVFGLPPEIITSHSGDYLEALFCDLPPCLPIVLSVNTNFVNYNKVIEIPLIILLEIESVGAILDAIHDKGDTAFQKA